MYRRRDDDQSIPEIEKFISEKLLKEMPEVNEVEIIDDDVEMDAEPEVNGEVDDDENCLLYTSPSPRDRQKSRMPSSA